MFTPDDVDRLARATYEAECGQPPAPILAQMPVWRERVQRAIKVLTIIERLHSEEGE